MFSRVVLAGAMMLCITPLASAQNHRTWYLAEGATNAFFQEEILIANPTGTAANVTVTFLPDQGAESSITFSVAATSRHTLRVNEVAGLETPTRRPSSPPTTPTSSSNDPCTGPAPRAAAATTPSALPHRPPSGTSPKARSGSSKPMS
jgi:hypothetical protein